jgi:hypothetical protein
VLVRKLLPNPDVLDGPCKLVVSAGLQEHISASPTVKTPPTPSTAKTAPTPSPLKPGSAQKAPTA